MNESIKINQAVETFWTYCAERIQSVWRGKKSRKTLGGAMRMWMRRELEWKRTVLRAWFKAVMNVVSVRYRCRKPFWEWHKHAVKLRKLHHLFAACFWPIYTWRKVTREGILQRQKAGMLRNIYLTASSLTCFRA